MARKGITVHVMHATCRGEIRVRGTIMARKGILQGSPVSLHHPISPATHGGLPRFDGEGITEGKVDVAGPISADSHHQEELNPHNVV